MKIARDTIEIGLPEELARGNAPPPRFIGKMLKAGHLRCNYEGELTESIAGAGDRGARAKSKSLEVLP